MLAEKPAYMDHKKAKYLLVKITDGHQGLEQPIQINIIKAFSTSNVTIEIFIQGCCLAYSKSLCVFGVPELPYIKPA